MSKDEQGAQSEAELIACLDHLDGAVRAAAIDALGRLEAAVKSKYVAAVVGLLKKSGTKAHVRQEALTALAALDQSLSTEQLVMAVEMLADSAHNVRMAALNLLKLSPNPNPNPIRLIYVRMCLIKVINF